MELFSIYYFIIFVFYHILIMFFSDLFFFDFKKLKKIKKNYDIVLISFCFYYIKNKKIDPNIIKWIDLFYICVLYIFS